MRLLISFILLSTLFTSSALAQNTERQVLNVSGSNFEGSGFQISSSIGEAIVGTSQTGILLVMQGFLVGGTEAPTGLISYRDVWIDYTIYPNPTYRQLNVKFDTEHTIELMLALTDMQGNTVQSKSFRVDASLENHFSLDMYDLNEGLYLLQIQDSSGKQLRVFTIFKKN